MRLDKMKTHFKIDQKEEGGDNHVKHAMASSFIKVENIYVLHIIQYLFPIN